MKQISSVVYIASSVMHKKQSALELVFSLEPKLSQAQTYVLCIKHQPKAPLIFGLLVNKSFIPGVIAPWQYEYALKLDVCTCI